jgi:hypothetical protein
MSYFVLREGVLWNSRPLRSSWSTEQENRKMKRLIVLLAAVSVPLLAACEPPPGSPPCTNIIGGGGFFDGTDVFFSIDLEADPCPDVKYRLIVEDAPGGPRLATSTFRGTNDYARVDYAVAVTDDDPTVCVKIRTIAADGQRLDLAPDDGCLELTVGEDPPARRVS